MVAIVAGQDTGLFHGSLAPRVGAGQSTQTVGQAGEGVFVNVAQGNLVLQRRDELLVGRGADADVLRTYNSQAKLTDDNGDAWWLGSYRLLRNLTGTVNTAGSRIERVSADGSLQTFTYANGRYASTQGDGAHDSLNWDGSAWTWTDGSTRVQERYAADGAVYRLNQVKDPAGNAIAYRFNNGLLTSATLANGDKVDYVYAGRNLSQEKITRADGTSVSRTHYQYDSANRLSEVRIDLSPDDNRIADGKVYTVKYTYDGSSQRLAGLTQTDGSTLRFSYTEVSAGDFRIASVTDGLGQVTRFAYDTAQRITTVTDPLGQATRYTCDPQGRFTQVEGPDVEGRKQSLRYTYDADGNLRQTTDALGNSVTYTYDANGNQLSQQDSAGVRIDRRYNAQNQLISETTYRQVDPDGAGAAQASGAQTTRYVYDDKQNLRFVLSPTGRVTETRYDGFGQRSSQLAYSQAVYDVSALGIDATPTLAQLSTWATAQTNSQVSREDYAYDGRGGLQQTTRFGSVNAQGIGIATDATMTRHTYDLSGRVLTQLEVGTGRQQTHGYDGLGRLLSTLDSAAPATTVTRQYDDAGKKLTLTQVNGRIDTQSYDSAGQLIGLIKGSLAPVSYRYDANGNKIADIDSDGKITRYVYDANQRLRYTVSPLGVVTEQRYDTLGRVTGTVAYATPISLANTASLLTPLTPTTFATRLTPSADDRSSWQFYDQAGRLTKKVDAEGYVTSLNYDGAGRLLSETRHATPTATALQANLAAEAVVVVADAAKDRTTRYFYDADGKQIGVLDAAGYLTRNDYDGAGRLVHTVRYANATPANLRQTGELAALTPVAHAQDQHSWRVYDSQDRLVGSIDPEGYLTELRYDAAGRKVGETRYATVAKNRPDAATISAPTAANDYAALVATHGAKGYWPLNNADGVARNGIAGGQQGAFPVGGGVSNRSVLLNGIDQTVKIENQPRPMGDSSIELWFQPSAEQNYLYHIVGLAGWQFDTEVQRGLVLQGDNEIAYRDWITTNVMTSMGTGVKTEIGQWYHAVVTHKAGKVEVYINGELKASGTPTQSANASSTLFFGGLVWQGGQNRVLNGKLMQAAIYDVPLTADDIARHHALGRVAITGGAGDRIAYADQVKAHGAKGYWPLNDADGVARNVIAGGQAGTYPAGGSLVNGALGQAVQLNGIDQAIKIENQPRPMGDGSIELWFQPTNAQNYLYHMVGLAGWQFDTEVQRGLVLQGDNEIAYRDWITTNVMTSLGTGVKTEVGKWYHAVVTHKAGKVEIYINGELKASGTPTHSANASSTLFFGGVVWQAGQNRVLNGKLAQAAIYDVPLTAEKIAQHYALGRTAVAGSTITPTLAGLRPTAHSEDRTVSYTYTARGEVETETTTDGTVTRYAYNVAGNLLRKTTAANEANQQRSLVTDYDELGRVTRELSAQGVMLTEQDTDSAKAERKRLGYPEVLASLSPAQKTALQAAHATTYAYDNAGRRISSTDARGNTTRYYYDAAGQLRYTVNALGEVRKTDYTAFGEVSSTTAFTQRLANLTGIDGGLLSDATQTKFEQLGNAVEDKTSRINYTLRGLVKEALDSLGKTTSTTYTAFGEVDRLVSPIDTGRVTTTHFQYDARGKLISAWQDEGGLNLTKATEYDAFGRATALTDASGNTTRTDYDRLGRTVVITDPLNAKRTTAYDAFDRTVSQTDALGHTTTTAYDTTNRRITVTTADGVKTSSERNRHGEVVKLTDGNGHTTTYQYNADGKLQSTTDALGNTSRKDYDSVGNVISTTDANGTVTQYQYDAANRQLQKQVDPTGLNLTSRVTLDGQGRTVTSTDANGVITRNHFDRKGQLTAVVVDEGGLKLRTEYRYDDQGNKLSFTEGAGTPAAKTTEYAYDNLGRRISETVDPTGLKLTTRYEYDAAGNVIAKTDAIGNKTRFAYDANGRNTHIVDALGYATERRFDAVGQLVATRQYATPLTPDDLVVGSATTHGGSQAARVWYKAGDTSAIYRNIGNFKKGDTVTASVWFKTDAKTVGRIFLGDLGPPTPYSNAVSAHAVGNDGWQKLTVTKTLTEDELLNIHLYGDGGSAQTQAGNNVIYDDLQVESVQQGVVFKEGFESGIGEWGKTAQVDVVSASSATTLNGEKAAQVWYKAGDTSAIYRNIGNFKQGDTVTASVWFKTDAKTVGRIFLGDLGPPTPYSNAVSTHAFGSNGWQKLTVTKTLTEDELLNIHLYGDGGSVHQQEGNSVIYDDLQVESVRQGVVFKEGFESGLGEWGKTSKTAVRDRLAPPTMGLDTTALTRLLAQQTRTEDQLTEYTYDALGRKLTEVVDPAGLKLTTRYTYDNAGNVATKTDANGHATAYTYDSLGRKLTEVVDPTGLKLTTRFEYDATGKVTAKTDGNAVKTAFTYDKAGRLQTEVVDPNGLKLTTRLDYDAAGRVLAKTDANDTATAYTYDTAGRKMTEVVDSAGLKLTTRFDYDAADRVTTKTDAKGVITAYSYDTAGRVLTEVIDPAGLKLTTGFEYDVAGRVVNKTAANGTVTAYTYDTVGNKLTEIVDPNGLKLTTRFSYDAARNVISSIDANGNETRFAYDAANRKVGMVDAKGRASAYTLDGNGKLIAETTFPTFFDNAYGPLPPGNGGGGSGPVGGGGGSSLAEGMTLARGDFNGDGLLDLFISNKDISGRMFVRYGTAGGGYSGQVEVNSDHNWAGSQVAAVMDFNRDGKDDILLRPINYWDMRLFNSGEWYSKPDGILFGQDRGMASAPFFDNDSGVARYVGLETADIWAFGDFDGDGKLDVFARNPEMGPELYHFDEDDLPIRKSNAFDARFFRYHNLVAYGDVNGDGKTDLLLETYGTSEKIKKVWLGKARNPDVKWEALKMATDVVWPEGFGEKPFQYSSDDAYAAVAGGAAGFGGYPIYDPDAPKPPVWVGKTGTGFYNDPKISLSAMWAKYLSIMATLQPGESTRTEFTYDTAGRLTQQVADPAGLKQTTRLTYDAAGNVATKTDASGLVTAYTYDAAGRKLTETADPNGLKLTTTYSYDSDGNVVAKTGPNGAVTHYTYDGANRKLTEVLDPTGLKLTTQFAYNGANQLVSKTDANGVVTAYTFDAAGNKLTEVVDPAGLKLTTRYRYDAAGNVIAKVDANGHETRFAYDVANRKVGQLDAEGLATAFGYDGTGKLTSSTAFQTIFADATPTGTGAPGSIWRGKGDKGFFETAAGLSANWTSYLALLGSLPPTASRRTEYAYDAVGQQTQVTMDPAGKKATTKQSYDFAGRVSSKSTADGKTTRYLNDNLGRQRFSIDGAGFVQALHYNAAGQVVAKASYEKPIKLSGTLTEASILTALGDAKSVVIEYTYDLAGNKLTEVLDPACLKLTTRFTYDAAGQLTSKQDPNGGVTRYTYDAAGRLHYTLDAAGFVQVQQYDAAGQVTSKGAYDRPVTLTGEVNNATVLAALTAAGMTAPSKITAYTYDAAGRKLSETTDAVSLRADTGAAAQPLQLVTRFEYDALGNLKKRIEAAGIPGQERISEFGHDKLGRQTTLKQVGFGALSSHGNLANDALYNLADLDRAAAGEAAFTPTSTTHYDPFGNAVAYQDISGNWLYKAYDHAGRIVFETDAEGYLTEYVYDIVGNRTRMTRYGTKFTLTAGRQAGYSLAEFITLRNGLHWSAEKRTLNYTYDHAGRVLTITEPTAYQLDRDGDTLVPDSYGNKETKNAYNAQGQLVKQSVLIAEKNNQKQWADTTYYYDAAGRKTAQVDAEGYLTQWVYDGQGKVTREVQFAKALATGSWTEASEVAALAASVAGQLDAGNGESRSTRYEYDHLGNRTAEIRENQLNIGADLFNAADDSRVEVATRNRYDAYGNVIETTDARGNRVFSYYDALGRLTHQAHAKQRIDNNDYYQVTQYERDAHGNAVRTTRFADAIMLIKDHPRPETLTLPTPNAMFDRVELRSFDLAGHETEYRVVLGLSDGVVGNQIHKKTFYDKFGRAALEWQAVADVARGQQSGQNNQVKAFSYDRTGNHIGTFERIAAPIDSTGYTTTVKASEASYNAFGEVTQRTLDRRVTAQYEYDDNGRVWRKQEAGVWSVHFYNRMGWEVAKVMAPGEDVLTGSIKASDIGNAALFKDGVLQTGASRDYRKTFTFYDKLGRQTKQLTPGFSTHVGTAGTVLPTGPLPVRSALRSHTGGGTTVLGVDWAPVNDVSKFTKLIVTASGEVPKYIPKRKGEYVNPSDEHGPKTEHITKTAEVGITETSVEMIFSHAASSQIKLTVLTVEGVRADGSKELIRVSGQGAHHILDIPLGDEGSANWVRLTDSSGNVRVLRAPLLALNATELGMQNGDVLQVQLVSMRPGDEITAQTPSDALVYRALGVSDYQLSLADGAFTLTAATKTYKQEYTPTTLASFDRWGNKLSMTNAGDVTTAWQYNSQNQIVRETGPVVDKVSVAATTRSALTKGYAYSLTGDLLATQDGNGHLTRQQFDQFGRLNKTLYGASATDANAGLAGDEIRYDTQGRVSHTISKLGEQPLTTYFSYNRMDQLIRMQRDTQVNQLLIDANGVRVGWGDDSQPGFHWTRQVLASEIRYDAAGNRVLVEQRMGYQEQFKHQTWHRYDTQGKMVESEVLEHRNGEVSQGMRQALKYDLMGNKVQETSFWGTREQPSKVENKEWQYDLGTGRLKRRTDLGNNNYERYRYDGTGALLGYTYVPFGPEVETIPITLGDRGTTGIFSTLPYGTRTLSKTHHVIRDNQYDEAGQLIEQSERRFTRQEVWETAFATGVRTDSTHEELDPVSLGTNTYRYDPLGRVSYESVTKPEQQHWSQVTQYDEAGRVKGVFAKGVGTRYGYDGNGNRITITGTHGDNLSVAESWYSYDAMNRVTLSQGERINGEISNRNKGEHITYLGSTQQRSSVSRYRADGTTLTDKFYYDGLGQVAITAQRDSAPSGRINMLQSRREYDYLGRTFMEEVRKPDGEFGQRRHNSYDASGRLIKQETYLELGKWSTPPAPKPPIDRGRMVVPAAPSYPQAIVAAAPSQSFIPTWIPGTVGLTTTYNYEGSRLADYKVVNVGKQITETVQTRNGEQQVTKTIEAYTDSYKLTHKGFDSWREVQQERVYANTNDIDRSSRTDITTTQLDIHGNTVSIADPNAHTEAQKLRTLLVDFNGRVLSKTGGGSTAHYAYVGNNTVASSGGAGDQPVFDFSSEARTNTQAPVARSVYVVNAGDTMRKVAFTLWGDSSLWYLIANENGLSPETPLQEGTSLRIPHVVSAANNAETYAPYNATRLVGDTTPSLPMPPPPKEGCGTLGTIIMVAVTIAVTVYLGPQAGAAVNGAVTTTAAVTATTVAHGMAAAAVGSMVGQGVGLAIGAIDNFSWKAVGTAALSAGVSSGMDSAVQGTWLANTSWIARSARAALSTTATQGVLSAAGISSFSWRTVAASAIAAPITEAIGDGVFGVKGVSGGMSWAKDQRFAANFMNSLAGGVVNRSTQIAVNGRGKFDLMEVAANAFGDVVGNSIAGNRHFRQWVEAPEPVVPGANRSERPRDWRDLFNDEVVPAAPVGNSGPTGDEGGYVNLGRHGEPYSGDPDGRVQGRGVAFRGNMYGNGTASAANRGADPTKSMLSTGKARLPAETVDEFNARVVDARLKGTLGKKGPIYDQDIRSETWKTTVDGPKVFFGNVVPRTINGVKEWVEQFAHTEPGALGRSPDWVDPRNPVSEEVAGDFGRVVGGLLALTPIKSGGKTVTLYRVDDAGFAPRIQANGSVPVVTTSSGGERALFVNLGQPQRAKDFALVNRGGNAAITAVEVDASFLERLRATSIYDKGPGVKLNPTAPLRVDVNKAPDQFGLRTPEHIQWLRDAIKPGTTRGIDPNDL